jgi:hypothetical protein
MRPRRGVGRCVSGRDVYRDRCLMDATFSPALMSDMRYGNVAPHESVAR